MFKYLVLIACLVFSEFLHADELYSFKKIDCFQEIQAFQISHVDIWNVGFNGIWRKDWEEHKIALKALEEKKRALCF